MRNHLMKSFVALMVFGALLAFASPTSAQWGRPDRFARANAGRLIRDAENRSDQFVAVFDRALDRGGMEGTVRAERLNERARDLESALNRVRQAFEQRSSSQEVRSELANAINVAEGINRVMRNRQLSFQAERQWSMLRSDLNRLAAIYNLRQFS